VATNKSASVNNEKRLLITQTKSIIGQKPKARATILALGLGKIGRCVSHRDRPEIRGMLNKVNHLVRVETSEESNA